MIQAPSRSSLLALAVMLGGCRARTPPAPMVEWNPGPSARAETAALLLLDKDGMTKVACLPGGTRRPYSSFALRRILDVGWKGSALVAGVAAEPGGGDSDLGDRLVLLRPNASPRKLAKDVLTARFSPDAAALAYEITTSSVAPASATSYVLDLSTDKLTKLDRFADPLWEADGKHLRGTVLRPADGERGSPNTTWVSLRARWDRESGNTSIDGRGSAQIPAPAGEGVAWSEDQRSAAAPESCAVLLRRRGGVRHSIVGRFCMGVPDDRAVRWSPDGRWLAFPHPGPVPGLRRPGGFFVDVVGIEGGRYPALSAVQSHARPEELAIATAPGSVWFDWSPSGRFVALGDGARDLFVYDFEAHALALLGKGERPLWSPRGTYLLVQRADEAARQAILLTGVAPAARIDLGPVQDARWLPPQVCEGA
jgi:hypothetical protein